MSRSLPDVRDGLKPVHRRLLHAMREMGLNPGVGSRKSAAVVGDVMGRYHPHGDASIYDAMVRLAQDFAQRYPLVDGQGNFGNIDGDNPAHMRYTEARLTEIAMLLLDGIGENAVDFRPSYDGRNDEPIVLPAAFPNLLANGAQGIAVGMATSVPPHNVGEICDALLHLIKFPKAAVGKLVELMPGPDFPTGGVLVEGRDTIVEAYRSGRGSLRVRAKWTKEQLKGGTYQIVVTEIPYQVQKARLIERIAALLEEKKLTVLDDVMASRRPRAHRALAPGRCRSDVLMVALPPDQWKAAGHRHLLDAENTPRVMSLPEVLRAYLDHRQVVLQRRTKFRLAEIEKRIEILDGYIIAYLNIDAVIKIIRTEDDPKPVMMKRWKLSDLQVDSILNMRLRALRRLEEIEIKQEREKLIAEQKDLKGLLKDDERQWKKIGTEVADLKKRFGSATPLGKRRTELGEAPSAVVVPLEAVVEREPVTIVCSDKGWVRALKGHVQESDDIKYKEGDRARFFLHAETTDKLLVFGTNGRLYTLGADKLPGVRGHGEPMRLMIDLGNDGDRGAARPSTWPQAGDRRL
jgi:topoisomerase-4 subunit A